MNKKTFADKCLERASMATPGPWHYDCGNGEVESHDEKHWRIAVAHRDDLMERIAHCEHFQLGNNPPKFPVHPDQDMEFIAHAREMVPELAKRLKRACESLRGIAMASGTHYPIELADELEAPLAEDEK